MFKLVIVILSLFIHIQACFAYCDITEFRWECDLLTSRKPVKDKISLVYCNDTPVYVNQAQYEIIKRYQRADINMVLRVNDEFVTGPCIPAGREGYLVGIQ